MTLLEQVKLLLGIRDTEKDALLSVLCDTVVEQVKTYCRLSDVSGAGLQGLMADMVVSRYRARGYGQEAEPKVVSSISEGDTSISYKTTQPTVSGELTEDDRRALAQYRKLWP